MASNAASIAMRRGIRARPTRAKSSFAGTGTPSGGVVERTDRHTNAVVVKKCRLPAREVAGPKIAVHETAKLDFLEKQNARFCRPRSVRTASAIDRPDRGTVGRCLDRHPCNVVNPLAFFFGRVDLRHKHSVQSNRKLPCAAPGSDPLRRGLHPRWSPTSVHTTRLGQGGGAFFLEDGPL